MVKLALKLFLDDIPALIGVRDDASGAVFHA
jgi:hypothetical protein